MVDKLPLYGGNIMNISKQTRVNSSVFLLLRYQDKDFLLRFIEI